MADEDLELGRLDPLHTLWRSQLQTFSDSGLHESAGAGATKATARAVKDGPQKQENEDHDAAFVAIPRQKLEQLMILWTEVLQMSLGRNRPQDLETLTLAVSPKIHQQRPFHLDVDSGPTSVFRNIDASIEQTSRINMVNVMSESEILKENESRRSIRQQWRPSEKYAYLEDSWKHLWEPKQGTELGPFQWSHPEEKRKALQLDLMDAFNAQSGIFIVGAYMRNDLRSIASWISLIGLRLSQTRVHKKLPRFDSAEQIQVLIECLWCCNTFTPKLDIPQHLQGPTVGDVLSSCYRRRVLLQPMVKNGRDELTLRDHFKLVRTALYLINTLYKHHSPSYGLIKNVDDTWNMQLSSVETSMRHTPSLSDFDGGKDTFCCLDDLNLKDLQTLGQLRIQWTSYWDEHLQLETSSNVNILKVYWFQPALAQFLVQKWVHQTFFARLYLLLQPPVH